MIYRYGKATIYNCQMPHKTKKLAQDLRRVLSEALREVPPELGLITITEVELAGDWGVVTTWISSLGHHQPQEVLSWLDEQAHKLQKAVAQLGLKRLPELRFKLDERPDHGQVIENLLQ